MTPRDALLLALLLAAGPAAAQGSDSPRRGADTESLFLDMTKVNLGTITTEEDKKKYLYTIQLEKARITRKTLRAVYENAYDLYRSGDYEGTRELTAKILAIDPGFDDAAILQRASTELRGSRRPMLSERKLVEDKFEEGMALYRQGRIVEASERWEEAVKLAPGNLKARYWVKKARGEIADEHFRRGQKAYRQHRLRDALDQWYAALVLNPRYPRLMSAISKVEAELRESEGNDKLQTALNLYSQGRTEESLAALDQVLQVEPGDSRAQKLIAEIRGEIANQHVAEGRRLYESRKYAQAIDHWKKAVTYGYDPRASEQLIVRAKEQIKKEAEAKKRAAELAQQRKEAQEKRKADEAAEAARKAKEEEENAKKALTAQPGSSMPGGSPPPTGGPTAQTQAPAVTEDSRRQAVGHWNSGIIYFQKGDFEKARDEWMLCKQMDPSNSDCQTGLQRIDQQYGGGQ